MIVQYGLSQIKGIVIKFNSKSLNNKQICLKRKCDVYSEMEQAWLEIVLWKSWRIAPSKLKKFSVKFRRNPKM